MYKQARIESNERTTVEYVTAVEAEAEFDRLAARHLANGYVQRRLQMILDGPNGETIVLETEPV